MEFEWDEQKERGNIAKHRLNFHIASRVFLDPFVIDFEDDRDYHEMRWNAVGMVDGRLLVVTYTMRAEKHRIISARGAEPYERRKYHKL